MELVNFHPLQYAKKVLNRITNLTFSPLQHSKRSKIVCLRIGSLCGTHSKMLVLSFKGTCPWIVIVILTSIAALGRKM